MRRASKLKWRTMSCVLGQDVFLCVLGQFWLQPKVGDGLILCPSNPISTCRKEDDQVILRRLIKKDILKTIWVVVSNIFYVHPYLGKWSNLTNIFQMGWNHQLAMFDRFFPIKLKASFHANSRLAVVRDSISAKGQKGDPLQSLMSLGWDEVTPQSLHSWKLPWNASKSPICKGKSSEPNLHHCVPCNVSV